MARRNHRLLSLYDTPINVRKNLLMVRAAPPWDRQVVAGSPPLTAFKGGLDGPPTAELVLPLARNLGRS